jgi:hypothetical protein
VVLREILFRVDKVLEVVSDEFLLLVKRSKGGGWIWLAR